MRLRRSILFVPGDSPQKMEKSVTLGADCIVLDLEDSVETSKKDEARKLVKQVLSDLNFGPSEKVVRVNSLNSRLILKDLEETISGSPDAYLIPKVSSEDDIIFVDRHLSELEQRNSMAIEKIKLLVLATETPEGVLNIQKIAKASSRIEALIWSAEDLSGELGAGKIKDEKGFFLDVFRYARIITLLASKALGIDAIDAVYTDLWAVEGLKREAMEAASMGFTGKLAIHPKQVEVINHIFTPSKEEVEEAQELIKAFEERKKAGIGVFTFKGKMVDVPHLKQAQRIVDRAKAIDILKGPL